MKQAIILVSLLLIASGAVADFVNTSPDEDNVTFLVPMDDSFTDRTTNRTYTVDNVTEVTYKFVANPPHPYLDEENYTVDFHHCTQVAGVESCTPVRTGVKDTNATNQSVVAVNTTYFMRAVMHFPDAANLSAVDVPMVFHIALNESADGSGSGGSGLVTLAHRATLRFYDPLVDSDGDRVDDDCELDAFGDLSQGENDDPDGDGFTNREECEAGSDPNDPKSTPEKTLGGGGNLSDREAANAATGFFLWAIIVFLTVLFLRDRAREHGAIAVGFLVAAAILGGFFALFFFDLAFLSGPGWAWWASINTSWQVWTVFAVGASLMLFGGAGAFVQMNQRKEVPLALAVTAGVAAFAALLFLLFGVLDLQVPF